MAKLYFEDGRVEEDLSVIQEELSPLSITVAHWPIDDTTKSILAKRVFQTKNEKMF